MATGCELKGVDCEIVHPGGGLRDGMAFIYGMEDYTLPLILEAERKNREWLYADNAYYFGRGSHFRVTRNALMHDGLGDAAPDRFRSFGLDVHPWKRGGRIVLVTSQSRMYYTFRMGISRDEWFRRVKARLRKFTDREIVPCWKPEAPQMRETQPHHDDFESLLKRAWIVVTESSSTGVGALLAGVPVISLGPSMCTAVATEIEDVEKPHRPDFREQWLWNLAAQQWTYEEMRSGQCWDELQNQPQAWAGHKTDAGVPIGV